jgi:phosphotransferase system enzyme I (PtsI)
MQSGTGVSRGIAIGKALVYDNRGVQPTGRMITVGHVDEEKQRILQAVVDAQRDLQKILDAQDEGDSVIRDLIEVQIEVAEDPALLSKANQYVEVSLNEAGDALLRATEDLAVQLEKLEAEYFRARAADVRDVGTRLAANAFGVQLVNLSHLEGPVVVFARDITPSETATMDRANVLGFVTEVGSQTSHTAILAKMLEIPAIVGLRPEKVRSGQLVVIDGTTGELVIEPNSTEIDMFEKRRARFIEDKERLHRLKDLPSVSLDGVEVELAINIASAPEAARAAEVGAHGIGLFRTEFIYMGADEAPTEDQQFAVYRATVEEAQGRPVIIRTLDAGGDKEVPYLKIPAEDNPFLGYRAIRVCLDNPEMFKAQIRAILRASAFGNVKIMFPMISSLSQLKRSKVLVNECKADLQAKGLAFNASIEIGIMVEIPAVAAAAEIFAPHVQFFSIGTNDLCQYSLAVDRMNPKIADLYSHYNPGVLRLIKHTVDAAKAAGIKVGMCGEMAGALAATPLLFGLGLDEFSMSPANVPYVKDKIRGLTLDKAAEITDIVMSMDSAIEIKEYLEALE